MGDGDLQRRRRRLVALIAAAGLAVALLIYRYDLAHLDANVLADRVRTSGAVGPLALIALLVAQAVVAPLPSPPILMAAGFVYGPWLGFGIGWLGLLLGASSCFGLARALGRPFAQRLVGGAARYRRRLHRSAHGCDSLRHRVAARLHAASLRCGQLRLRPRSRSVPVVCACHRSRRGPQGWELHVHRLGSGWHFELAHRLDPSGTGHRRGWSSGRPLPFGGEECKGGGAG